MFCPKCGAKIDKDATKCPNCGQHLVGLKKRQAAVAAQPQSSDPKPNEAQPKPAATKKTQGQKRKLTWVGLIVALLAIFFGYQQLYVPHLVESSLADNHLSTERGYQASVDPWGRKVVITFSNGSDINRELQYNGYDRTKIPIENELSNVAHDINGRTVGEWTIEARPNSESDFAKLNSAYWVYKGTRETKQFQSTAVGTQLRERYLNAQEQAERDRQDKEASDQVAAGVLGAGLGAALTSPWWW